MGDLFKYGKAWAISGMVYKGAMAASLIIGAVAFAFGDGGTFTVSWVPNAEVQNVDK